MGKIALFALFFVATPFFIPSSYSEILINEILPDPIADESLNEWIELYNNGTEPVNVSGWLIGDDADNDTIEGGLYNKEGALILPFGFAILTDDNTRVYNNFNVSPDSIRLYTDDSAIGNGLLNTGETIFLYDNSTLIHNADYPETKEGFSASLVNNSWMETEPTPGYTNQNAAGADACDYEVAIILTKTIFESSEFSFRVRATKLSGGSTNVTGNAEIEDFFGDALKEYQPWKDDTISIKRTSSNYSPNLKAGSYIINANLSTSCPERNMENNFASEIITIKGEKPSSESEIKIKGVLDLGSDKTAKFGQTIRLSLDVYKGDTNKKSIAVWLEDKKGHRLSKQSKAALGEKFTKYGMALPLQIIPNCDNEFKNGSYTVKAEGLDSRDEERIELEGITESQCQEIKEEKGEGKEKGKEAAKNEPKSSKPAKNEEKAKSKSSAASSVVKSTQVPGKEAAIGQSGYTAKEPVTIYESSSEKSKKLALTFLLILSVLLNIILVWRR